MKENEIGGACSMGGRDECEHRILIENIKRVGGHPVKTLGVDGMIIWKSILT
jgi:hypothetical protein